ncbi:YbbR-like domain-containing protein [Labilibaculum sp.]|uniref:YbbR-like domain-containing protein n=1 Tax=Labilibaculum sp. TaxID=2060723 RepID=UPI002AA95FC8|nr:YbbR-like domain-containing protein [Labilibaculum sp.]MBN2598554.1 YbbR-like domain-containing protein [Marinifilaceae bacterium]
MYVFFVGIATIFWFLNALNKEYTTEVNYPVRYINLPQNKVLTNKLPGQFSLKVNAKGFDLIRYELSSAFLSNPFDVGFYTDNRLKNSTLQSLSLATSQIMNRFEKDLSSSIKLISISPDTIRFEFSPIVEKKVPIKSNVSSSFEQQYMLDGEISLEYDSMVVKGPNSILDSIYFVETEKLILTNLNKTVKKNVSLKQIEGLEFDQRKIEITVPVEQFTEEKVTVPIKVNNLPDSLLLRLFPGDVTVSYFVGFKKHDKVSVDLFDVRVDYNHTSDEGSNKLKIQLLRSPGFVTNVRFYPQEVTYLKEKKSFQ